MSVISDYIALINIYLHFFSLQLYRISYFHPPLLLYVSCLRRSDIPLVCNQCCLVLVYIFFIFHYVHYLQFLSVCDLIWNIGHMPAHCKKSIIYFKGRILFNKRIPAFLGLIMLQILVTLPTIFCSTKICLILMLIYFYMQQGLSSTETFTLLASVLKLEWKVQGDITRFL